jgi:hypothetical protein
MRTLQNLTIFLLKKRLGLFGSDWWEGSVFSRLMSGGNRRLPKAAMRRGQDSPAHKSLKKTSPGATELTESPILAVKNAKF